MFLGLAYDSRRFSFVCKVGLSKRKSQNTKINYTLFY